MKTVEELLVEQAKKDRQAFSELYQQYAPRIYNYIYQRTHSSLDAEEMTATVFLRALSHLDSYEHRGQSFGVWLFTIAHNLLVNWYRRQGRKELPSLQESGEEEDIAATLATAEEQATVRRAIASLPEQRQQLIFLKYIEGLSNAEIGRIMGRSEGAIKSLLHRTLLAMRRQFQSERERS